MLYGYLGTFSCYGSDDYCLSAFFHREGSSSQLMVERYMTSSSRYTNILFIGLADKLLGWYNVAILPPLMLGAVCLGNLSFDGNCGPGFSGLELFVDSFPGLTGRVLFCHAGAQPVRDLILAGWHDLPFCAGGVPDFPGSF